MTDPYSYKARAGALEQYCRTPDGELVSFPHFGPRPLKLLQLIMLVSTAALTLLFIICFLADLTLVQVFLFFLLVGVQGGYWWLWWGTEKFTAKGKTDFYGF